ncbi:MAG: protein-L-isoaspartate(D-aspartate) O-methyltransferase [Candidatus Aenigmarchaeota archaeon]|nr:protein-L-isoaspartate(D-aspartate) O-methyltransferase [Candidatus Aenigmarchaeota archaeon]
MKENERLVEHLISVGALKTPRIIEAFKKIPRHLFVREEYLSHAYDDIPLPTYCGQTISQPYTVAVMTEALDPKPGEKILEIGAGSAWQAALLAYCVGKKGKVITVELEKTLVDFAKKNLKKFIFKLNVEVICADGKKGYEKEAPYDKCIITAGCNEIPRPVLNQTKVGGKIVAPVNDFFGQRMMVIDKISEKEFKKKDLGSFVFVPLR